MEVRALNNPFSKSFLLHLLMFLVLLGISVLAPKLENLREPISITLIDSKKKQTDVFEGEKDHLVKQSRSARETGRLSQSPMANPIANSSQDIQVKDLGVKISTTRSTPSERRKNWAAEALGEEFNGGEYVEGLKEDETSALNTKEYIFYSYTERMRGQLYNAWAPIIRREVERFYGMGFTLSDHTNFVTRTRVIINSKGEVIKVQLLQESGVLDLDEAAITALNKAGPYPNPPKGLINAKGNADLRWNFILRN